MQRQAAQTRSGCGCSRGLEGRRSVTSGTATLKDAAQRRMRRLGHQRRQRHTTSSGWRWGRTRIPLIVRDLQRRHVAHEAANLPALLLRRLGGACARSVAGSTPSARSPGSRGVPSVSPWPRRRATGSQRPGATPQRPSAGRRASSTVAGRSRSRTGTGMLSRRTACFGRALTTRGTPQLAALVEAGRLEVAMGGTDPVRRSPR